MSKKRGAAESSSNDQTNEGSDPGNNAKRAKLALLSDTTLSDLPVEMLEYILIKVVAMEVKSMKMVKSVWKEKADLVINRLRTVCSHWSGILTTNVFRKEVHRILDGTAQEKIRLEMLHESAIQLPVYKVATMRDEIFMLCRPKDQVESFINVHDRHNMMEIKDVIPLPGMKPWDVAACSVSNCVYVLSNGSHCFSVLRITTDEEHQFNISPWISDLSLSFSNMSLFASVNGGLIILSKQLRPNPCVVGIYDANGVLQHEITLSPDVYGFRVLCSVIQKSNGNLVLETINGNIYTELLEIDTNGRIVRRYQSQVYIDCCAAVADIHGRIAIISGDKESELLDSEFNLLISTDPQLDDYDLRIPHGMHYNRERNELVRLYGMRRDTTFTSYLTIFRFTEE